jgi:histidine triad (HIT) family protein
MPRPSGRGAVHLRLSATPVAPSPTGCDIEGETPRKDIAMTETDCLFCRMASGQMKVDKLHDDDLIFAIDDINPRAPVHFMVIPKEHIATLTDLKEDQMSLLYHMIQVARDIAAKKGVAESGYRVAMNVGREGGQVVMHLHMHVLGGRVLRAEG